MPHYFHDPLYFILQKYCSGTKKGFIIPVVLEPISIPLVLRHISVVDNTRDLVKEFFWQKIKASMLTAPERSITLSEMAVLRVSNS